jgi:hypothetical protein
MEAIEQIKLEEFEISNLVCFFDELSNHHYDVHYYLKELNILLSGVDDVSKKRFEGTYKNLTELFSLLQRERESCQITGEKFREYEKSF